MMSRGDHFEPRLNDRDIRELARLHTSCMKDSLVTELGVDYARRFYRYLDRSSRELLWVRRDAESRIVAATVFTLEPDTLNRRLLFHTPLAWYFIVGAFRLLPRALRAVTSAPAWRNRTPECDLPEWIILFTAETQRGRGLAASLIKEMEDQLRTMGIKKYVGKTNADPASKALAFHLKHGCTFTHFEMVRGQRNQVFTKTVSA